MSAVRKGKFLKISCPRCSTKSIIFGKAAMRVRCTRCNYLLAKTGGGKAQIRAPVKDIQWN